MCGHILKKSLRRKKNSLWLKCVQPKQTRNDKQSKRDGTIKNFI